MLIIIIVLIVAIFGFLSYLNYTKGIFKTNKQKFFKYFSKNEECISMFNGSELQSIRSQKNQNPYRVDSSLVINSIDDSYTITSNTVAQNSSDITSSVDIQFNNEDLINFNLAKKSNLIGIKMDELANGYICFKNSNLIDLARNAGIEDTSKIPENINWISSMDILNFSQSDINYFFGRISETISKNIDESKFTKEKSAIKINDEMHTASGYKVTLTQSDTKNVLKNFFESLSKDSRSLNIISSKLKLLNVSSEYTKIDYLSNLFLETSKEIDQTDTSDEQYLEIICYEENENLIQTTIKIKNYNVINILLKSDDNSLNIKQDITNQNVDTIFKNIRYF